MFAFLKRHDWLLNLAVLVLATASLLIIYSISIELFWQQALWFLLAFILIIALSLINWLPLSNYRWFIWGIYGAAILLLAITLIFGADIRGSKSWLILGPAQFQTSEFAKLALIIFLASFLTKRHVAIAQFPTVLKTFAYFLLPTALILLQPDLGTAIILFAIWAGFLLVSGLPFRQIVIGFIMLAVLLFAGWQYFLKDYQKGRIIGLFDSGQIPYQVVQSKIAIGSAGFFGKGFGQGTQVQLGFLPEPATDSILAAFIEEWGLLGGLIVVGAFLLLLFRIINIGWLAEDNFTRLICLGAAIMFLVQFTLNVGSTLGLLPVVGVTFPFLSYGGSSLLINGLLVGMIQNIAIRQKL